jgi:hypothetical protein
MSVKLTKFKTLATFLKAQRSNAPACMSGYHTGGDEIRIS